MPLDAAERDPGATAERLIPLSQNASALSAVELTPTAFAARATARTWDRMRANLESAIQIPSFVRLLDPTGELVGIAEPTA
jgi:hypothetical protein